MKPKADPQNMPQAQLPRKRKVTTRSRNGCWTCRARRKKCDEKRPFCTPCERRSLQCGGYGPRLKWGNGVASRGYLMGSSIPVPSKDLAGKQNAGGSQSVIQFANITTTTSNSNSNATSTTTTTGKALKEPKNNTTNISSDTDHNITFSTSYTYKSTDDNDNDSVPSPSQFMRVLDFASPPSQNTMRSSVSSTALAASEKPISFFHETVVTPPSISPSAGTITTTPTTASTISPTMIKSALPLSLFDAEIFQEFKEWGSRYLSGGTEAGGGSSPFESIPVYCAESRSLVANCLTFQLTLHPEYEDKFEEYYAKSLKLFREDVCNPNSAVKDATLIAGILLCSIGMNRCMNWTVHLSGLHSMIQYRSSLKFPNRITSDILDTVGFFDLPTHVLGRKSQPLNIWRDYCRGKTGIESQSGIPHSLLDLLSTIAEPGIEAKFWTWSWKDEQSQNQSFTRGLADLHLGDGDGDGGERQRKLRNEPTASLVQLAWEATRLAAIIFAREYKQQRSVPRPTYPIINDGCPPTPALVETIISHLTTILSSQLEQPPPPPPPPPGPQYPYQQPHHQYQQQQPLSSSPYSIPELQQYPPPETGEILNLLLYPAFIAGTQYAILSSQQRERIEAFWDEFSPDTPDEEADGSNMTYIQVPLDILKELWRNPRGRTADMVAREWKVELALF
ncbi:hypothetical protein FQN57_001788 [Myotisia sp. PD_48]|nr:hypothetical protein FQN57_001788 [Myotisia sp. PD_48]